MRLPRAAERVPALVGGAALLLFFRGVLGSDTFLARRDAFRLHLPLRQFVLQELAAHRLPSWYPDDGVGISTLGTLHTTLFHPLFWLTLGLPADQALKWQALSAHLIAFVGAYLLARQLHAPRAGRVLAGLSYALSGYLLSMSDNPLFSQSAAMLPWAALAAELLAREATLRRGALLALVLALTLWAGDVQQLLVQGGVVAAVLISRFRETRADGGLPRLALVLLGAIALFALLGAPVLAPTWAVFRESGRAAGLSADSALVWPLDPVRLLELPLGSFIPPEMLLGGWDVATRYLSGFHSTLWAASELFGTSALVCVLLAVAVRPSRRVLILYGGFALVGLLLALGTRGGLYVLLFRFVPLGNAFRYPEKMMPLAVLGLSVLAGWGVRGLRRLRLRGTLVLGLIGAFVLALSLLCGRAERVYAWLQGRDPAHAVPDPDVASGIASLLADRLLVAGAVVVALALLTALGRRRAEWGVVAAQLAQALLAGSAAFASGSTALLQERSPVVPVVERLFGAAPRRLCWDAPGYHFEHPPDDAALGTTLGNIRSLAPDHGARFGVGITNSYLPAFNGPMSELCQRRGPCGTDCSRAEGVRYGIVSADRFAELRKERPELRELQRFEDPSLVLMGDPEARGFAALPGLHFEPNEQAAQKALDERRFDLARQVVVVGTGADVPPATGTVRSRRPTPESIEAQIDLTSPGSVVISEACSAGWQAELDGAPVALEKANLVFCRVVSPVGHHVLQLHFEPPGWPLAWAAYLLGLAGLALAFRLGA